MRDHPPTEAQLPIDKPDDPPELTAWTPGPSRFIAAILASAAVFLVILVIGFTAGWGAAATVWLTVILVISIAFVGLVLI